MLLASETLMENAGTNNGVSDRVKELCKMLEEGGIKYSDELIGFSKPVGRQKSSKALL